jgi:competence ComEA-like helix-hairpin-helix protein
MTLTHDEQRALGFIAALLFLSAAVRVANLPDRVPVPGEPLDLAAHIAATERAVAAAERRAEPLAPGERLDPNTAPEVELARLPRVGPALARRIVEDRERNGPFRSAGDLARVPGVGQRLVELASPHLDLPATAPSAPAWSDAAAAAGAAGSSGSSGSRPGTWPGGASPATGLAGPQLIDLNTADAAALEALPGVGPVLAARIVAYRDSVGGLTSPEELLAVRGIGAATLERLRPRLRVAP